MKSIKPNHIIISFFILGIIYWVFIMNMNRGNQNDFYKKEIHQTIIEIIPVRGHPLQKRVRLNDSTVVYLQKKFVPIVQIGDSIFKKSNEEYIYLKSSKKNKVYKARKKIKQEKQLFQAFTFAKSLC